MVSQRTWARIIVLGEIVVFPLRVYQWRRAIDTDGASVTSILQWLVGGGLLQMAYCWAYDHDRGTIRTKRWRRVLLAVGWGILGLRVLPRSEALWRSFSIGGSIGRLSYRLWYGVLRPLPGSDE